MAKEVTFYDSLKAGVNGMFAGALILGAIGFIAGGVLGAGLGAASLLGSGEAVGLGLIGAISFAQMGATAGSLIGAFTGVASSREVRAPDPQDIINIANMSFAQGVEVGKNQNVSPKSKHEVLEAASHFQDKLKSEQVSSQTITR